MLDVLISSEGCHSVDLMLTLIDGWSTHEAGEPRAHVRVHAPHPAGDSSLNCSQKKIVLKMIRGCDLWIVVTLKSINGWTTRKISLSGDSIKGGDFCSWI